jgi:hypothetical protein
MLGTHTMPEKPSIANTTPTGCFADQSPSGVRFIFTATRMPDPVARQPGQHSDRQLCVVCAKYDRAIGLIDRWDKRNKQVLERHNAKMTGDDWAQRANAPVESRVVRWWERYEKFRMVTFAIVLFALVIIAFVAFIASGL